MGFRRRKKEGRGTRERATTTRAVASVPEQGDFALVYGGYISWPRPWNRPPFLGSRRISALPLLFILAFVSFLPLLFIRITIYIYLPSPLFLLSSNAPLRTFFPLSFHLDSLFGSDIARLDKLSPLLFLFPFFLSFLSLFPRYPPTLVRISLQRASSQLSLSISLPLFHRVSHTSPTRPLSLSPSPRVVGLICETAVPGIHPRLGLSFIAASPLLFLRHY